MRKLLHEGFKVNDMIRAWDFQPVEGRMDRYVEGFVGRIERYGTDKFPYAHYRVVVMKDSSFPEFPRDEVIVPMEVSLTEWDNRVEKI